MCRQQLLNYRGSFLLNNKLSCNRLLAQARRGCVSTRTHKARRKGIKDGKKQSKQSQDNNKSSILAFKAVKHRPSVIFFFFFFFAEARIVLLVATLKSCMKTINRSIVGLRKARPRVQTNKVQQNNMAATRPKVQGRQTITRH